MVDVRKVDRTSRVVDEDKKKTSSKQDWYLESLEELEIGKYGEEEEVLRLVEQFERFSHTDLQEEVKNLKAKLCYLTMSMPVYFVLQPDYQFAIRFIIKNGLGVQEDFFGSWYKLRFKKGTLNAHT